MDPKCSGILNLLVAMHTMLVFKAIRKYVTLS